MNQFCPMCRAVFHWLFVLVFSVGPWHTAHAQAPEIEAWMTRHFSGEQGVKQDAKADEALYAAIGLDSLRKNRFIGQVNGTAKLFGKSMPVQFTLWCDTLEAMLRYYRPGDTSTFAADLRNNTITIVTTSTEAGKVNASINDLRERVVVNWYRYQEESAPWRVNRKKKYDTNGGILGQNMERWTVLKGDTLRFLRYEHGHSPFVDALEWLPYGGDYPFNLFMQLARAGDPMPRWLRSRAGDINITDLRMSVQPKPALHVGTDVLDTRTKAHRVLPIRTSNGRASVVELDPVVEIPDDESHRYGTPDPGRPGEPDVTYTGSRLRMRVNAKDACGDTGTVVMNVWIDRKGVVQRAEVDKKKSTIRSEGCWNNALEAVKKDTYYPVEGAMPLDQGVVVFEYKTALVARPYTFMQGNGTVDPSGGGGKGVRPEFSHGPFTIQLQGQQRAVVRKPDIASLPKGEGRVVMDIWVDRSGKVLRTAQGRDSTMLAPNLLEAARKAAMETQFAPDPKAPEEQRGRVIVIFQLE